MQDDLRGTLDKQQRTPLGAPRPAPFDNARHRQQLEQAALIAQLHGQLMGFLQMHGGLTGQELPAAVERAKHIYEACGLEWIGGDS